MKQRLHYFDIMKGVAIYLVVMGHILAMCVREVDRAPLFKFIEQIHMPLFFFISGWFAIKIAEDGSVAAPAFWPRAKRLLLPMLGASTLWIYYFPISGLQSPFDSTWSGLWFNEWKNGYWFTLVLFEISAVYSLSMLALRRMRSFRGEILVALGVWAVLLALWILMPEDVVLFLSLGLVAGFFPVFIAGVLAHRHSEMFDRVCRSSAAVTVSLFVIAAALAFVCWPWKYSFGNSYTVLGVQVLLQLALVIVAVAAIRPWSERAFASERPRPGRFASMWAFLGNKSLAIYMLHYFFLFPMPFVRPLLLGFDLAMTPTIVFTALMAAPVVALSLCADYILSYSSFFCTFFTGSTSAATPK